MKTLNSLLALLIFLLGYATASPAQTPAKAPERSESVSSASSDRSIEDGWEGIQVFKSRRVDVEKVFGKPFEEGVDTWYRKEGVVVRVFYSTIPCTLGSYSGSFNLPPETVISYGVTIGRGIPLSKLKFRKADYERWVNDHRPGQVEYFNSKAGVRFTSIANDEWGEVVGNIDFERTSEQDERYKCN